MPFRDFDADREEVSTLVAKRGNLEVRLMTWQDLSAFEELRDTNREWLAEWVVDNAVKKNTGALSFAVTLDEVPVGELTLWNVDRSHTLTSPSLSYWIDRAHARRGIMKFAVWAVLEHAINKLDLGAILIPIAHENTASVALADSLRLRRLGEADYEGAHSRHVVYVAERGTTNDL